MEHSAFKQKLLEELGEQLTTQQIDWIEQTATKEYEAALNDALHAISQAEDMQGVKDAIMVERLRLNPQ